MFQGKKFGLKLLKYVLHVGYSFIEFIDLLFYDFFDLIESFFFFFLEKKITKVTPLSKLFLIMAP